MSNGPALIVLESSTRRPISHRRKRDWSAPRSIRRGRAVLPWVTVSNPLARPGRADIPAEINLPPSGFICGIYARNERPKGREGAGQRSRTRRVALRARRQFRARTSSQSVRRKLPPLSPRARLSASGARGRRWIRRSNTSTSGATSFTWKRRSIAARSGPCSRTTGRGCGPTCARRSRRFSTTNGSRATCSAPRRRRLTSSAAIAAR